LENLHAFSLSPNLHNTPGKKALAIAQAGPDYDPALYAKKVDEEIAKAEGDVMVFSWSGCPFCKKAKALLDSKGAKYTALELDQMADGQKYRAALAER
jgi:Glutaredoxin